MNIPVDFQNALILPVRTNRNTSSGSCSFCLATTLTILLPSPPPPLPLQAGNTTTGRTPSFPTLPANLKVQQVSYKPGSAQCGG